MAVETGYPHIALDESGRPVIAGTTLKVIELVVEKLAYGWSPEELHLQHPSECAIQNSGSASELTHAPSGTPHSSGALVHSYPRTFVRSCL